MIIKVYEIEEGLRVKGDLDGSRYKRPEDADLSFLSPIAYDLSVEKFGENVRVAGEVSCELSLLCARCVEDFRFSIRADLDVELAPKGGEPAGHEVELTSEDLDLYYYEGDEIELDPYIYEEIVLNIPLKPLCDEACKGVCPECGTNLNLQECRCEKGGKTLLGEKLKSFLKDS